MVRSRCSHTDDAVAEGVVRLGLCRLEPLMCRRQLRVQQLRLCCALCLTLPPVLQQLGNVLCCRLALCQKGFGW